MAAHGLFAGPGAWRALAVARTGAVELVLGEGAYLAFGEDRVLVAGPGAAFGPLSLAVAGLGRLVPGMAARLAGDELVVGESRVSLRRARPRRALAPGPRGDGRAALGPLLAALPPPSEAVRPGLAALRDGRPGAAELLAGRGRGLTPEGDDVLAGYAAWLHAAGAPVRPSATLAGRTSPLALAYLRCAERGELPDPCARLLRSVRAGEGARAVDLVPDVRRWGESSGIAVAWGVLAGVVSTTVDGRTRWWMEDGCWPTARSSRTPSPAAISSAPSSPATPTACGAGWTSSRLACPGYTSPRPRSSWPRSSPTTPAT